jgi:RNA 2',3'-cyclic 3'-phosphodiesterase
MRLFIAINLPAPERQRIYDAAAPLRDAGFPIRWLEPETFHLTLKFLGNARSEVVPVVEKVIRKVASQTQTFPLGLSGFGAFPTIRRPRVLWMGADPTPALRCLKQDLEWALTKHGFERETRAFHPHVTLGRIDGAPGAGVFRGLDELAAGLDYSGITPVHKVDLMRSHASKKGPRYTLMESGSLKGVESPEG